MPKRTDIRSILLIGSGPIVIGQACEFDYSGTQALKALREEGYRLVLVNSNPATIMTDPGFADRTYLEPLTVESLSMIIERERPDALLPTIGGQTGLNLALDLAKAGVLERFGVQLIGASVEAIRKAEDRDLFKQAMERIGLAVPRSGYARSLEEARGIVEALGLPLIVRPSRTLGGTGGSLISSFAEFEAAVRWGLDLSPVGEVLIEESVAGWKEFELEVMRDGMDNVVIICSIENFDPMGIHTGDSITVAPAQTLTDKEYQMMRNAAIRIIREIGVDTGGSNIQFAVNPEDGRLVVIEMNPRVSRSSALASKATGFPIAKIAAKLAVGYSLDEIPNDITRETPACFEPTIDYVVTKIPRFTFEKFPQAADELGPQMKSVGEVMAIGRTFKESLHKAMRSLELDTYGFEVRLPTPIDREILKRRLSIPNAYRLWYIADAYRAGLDTSEIYALSRIDPWFLENIRQIVAAEEEYKRRASEVQAWVSSAKKMGFSDRRLAALAGVKEDEIREMREKNGVEAVFKAVDTCGAEFPAYTPYLYSTFEEEDESAPSERKKIMILGGGPNRIGQGIEFDYCCVHAALALREDGFETIMVNCNPETVSTDYDTSDKLYFEPLTLEDVLAIARRERPWGVIVQFGGQTPLKLALGLARAGLRIIGTSPESIDRAEDRERFDEVLDKLGLRRPANGIARSVSEAVAVAQHLGYPVLVRPSYVLGGRAMEIVYRREDLERYMVSAVAVSEERPVLVDKFLADATEVDVDAISDGKLTVIGGIMEHIEFAGVHSGDSACSLPPRSLEARLQEEIRRQTVAIAEELGVVGLMNVQYAIRGRDIFILEVNPRASRTIPFVSKAIGVPLAKLAARVMAGRTLEELGFTREIHPAHVSVKESVFPFVKFPMVDAVLGPEMKSTGEVMGIDADFGTAFAKAEIAAGSFLPQGGTVFVSVRDEDKPRIVDSVRRLSSLGFRVLATEGTASYLQGFGLQVEPINKVHQGPPHVGQALAAGEISMVINTPETDPRALRDSFLIRRSAVELGIPLFTTAPGAAAAAEGIEHLKRGKPRVRSLQEYHGTPEVGR